MTAGDATSAHIQRLAGYVDERMRVMAQIAKTVSLTRVAILAVLNIVDDWIKLQDHDEHTSHLLDTKTDQLIALMQEQFADP